jgi:zinc transporter, ZIP family
VRRLVTGLLVGAAIGAAAVALFARGDAVRTAAPAAEERGLAVQRSSVRPGLIVLFARNDGSDPVRIAQVMVNDAFVDFHAALLTVAPRRATQLSVHYPWVAGESYEIGLLTGTGSIVEYELEDAGET